LRVQENAALDRYKVEAAERGATLEKELALAKVQVGQLENAIAEADERAGQAKQHAIEMQKTVADASARAEAAQLLLERSKAPENPARQNSETVTSIAKFAGTKAAIYVVDEVPDAAEVGSTINAILTDAGWRSFIWTWSGVSGIVGVVVLTKEGDSPANDQAAVVIVDALRSSGFNAAKANWPADWHRYRGTLSGSQTASPTEAPIRVVIGAKSR
jgi:hypothetical protein